MRLLAAAALCWSLSFMAGGCAICQGPHDCDYPTYGGRWERTNRTHGRVGSEFDPAGAPAAEIAETVIAEPTPADAGEYLPEPGAMYGPGAEAMDAFEPEMMDEALSYPEEY